MKGKLIIDGNAIYEIDEECMRNLQKKKREEARKSSNSSSTKHKRR